MLARGKLTCTLLSFDFGRIWPLDPLAAVTVGQWGDGPVTTHQDRFEPRYGEIPVSVLPPHVAATLAMLTCDPLPVSAFIYDPTVAAQRAEMLRRALPRWVEIFYAVKANGFLPIMKALAPAVDGFDVSSIVEADLAAAAVERFDGIAQLVATGPGKTNQLLARVVAGGAIVNVESILELHRTAQVSRSLGRSAAVALRVNPNRVLLTDSVQFGGTATAFGIAEPEIPTAISIANSLPELDLVGFHFHLMTNNLDAPSHLDYIRWCLDWSMTAAAHYNIDVRVIDCGGGLGLAFQGERPFDLEGFADGLKSMDHPPDLRLLLEPGRWLVGQSGFYAAEVTDLKEVHGTWFAVLRGGINHFRLPTSWDIVHRFVVVPVEHWRESCSRPELRESRVTVVGELCTQEDTLVRDIYVKRLRPGDLVVFPLAGAYGWEFAMQTFIGHPTATRIIAAQPNG